MLALLCLVALAAPADDERRLQKGHAPTPFTAEQIRRGCPEGRTSTYLIEAPGQSAHRQTFRFLVCDATGAEFEVARTKVDGTPLGKPQVSRNTWRQLQSHASYPEHDTKITKTRVTTPVGVFECKLYTLTLKGAGQTTVQRAYFAERVPGPPVKMVREVDGETVFTMTLVAHKPFDYARVFGEQIEGKTVPAERYAGCAIAVRVVKGDAGRLWVRAAVEPDTASCAVRVTEGDLKGAVIRIPAGKDAARFPLPEGSTIPEGELAFEVIEFRRE